MKKTKTHFAKIVVSGTVTKPYYSIMWYDPTDRHYHEGYGSYKLGHVFLWLKEEFEIVDKQPRSDEMKADVVIRCAKCWNYDPDTGYCQFWHGFRPAGHYCREGVQREDE